MAIARGLRRLLRIRQLEEEQGRLALEVATNDLHRLESARAVALARDHRGRKLVESSARTGELHDRLAGLEETQVSRRLTFALDPLIAEATAETAELREEYLNKRIDRRQAETLLQEADARDRLDAERRNQQGLDDWFRNRLHRRALQPLARRPGAAYEFQPKSAQVIQLDAPEDNPSGKSKT